MSGNALPASVVGEAADVAETARLLLAATVAGD